jgi:hypothetical protein
MAITQAAVKEILNVMRRNGLDPGRFFLRLQWDDRAYGISFVSDPGRARVLSYGELRVALDKEVEERSFVIDYGLLGEQKGLIFR